MSDKIKPIEELVQDLGAAKQKKLKVVFTNGCFDILHPGHVRYLRDAKRFGDLLVVGMNSDASVNRIKGRGRPVFGQEDRASVLAAMECVDYISFFNEPTPLEIIRKVRPDVLVKGSDYSKEDIVGCDFVQGYGGEVATVQYHEGYSTTEIIEKIKNIKK